MVVLPCALDATTRTRFDHGGGARRQISTRWSTTATMALITIADAATSRRRLSAITSMRVIVFADAPELALR
jgi:hypothetical protein